MSTWIIRFVIIMLVISFNSIALGKDHPGKKLLEQRCLFCHNPSASEQSRIAPPMIAIKAHYLNEESTKESFFNDIKIFLDKPKVDNAKLKGAVRRFGLMPYQKINEQDLRLITDYLFSHKIEEPEWFKSHWDKKHSKSYINQGKKELTNQEKSPEEQGAYYALETKKKLGKNLISTINKSGTESALSFCNEQAIPLTKSIADKFSISIKRVSDRPRNPANKASLKETSLIEQYKYNLINKKKMTALVETATGGHYIYYSPIVTDALCMQCHGSSNEIDETVKTKLRELYPNDQAVDYTIGQVRGIWRIEFKQMLNK